MMDDSIVFLSKVTNAILAKADALILSSELATAWIANASDLIILLAYLLILIKLIYSIARRRGIPQAGFLYLLASFLLMCLAAHGLEMSWLRRLSPQAVTIAKPFLALLALATSAALLPRIREVLTLRNPESLRREIDQRRRTELELRQIHAQLEGVIELRTSELAAKNEEMEQFLNTVSHDLKNPVITSLGLAGILRDDLKAGRIDDSLDSISRIERSMTRMRHLIDELLNLSRIGRIRFEVTQVDTAAMLEGIRDDFRPRLNQSGVTLQIEDNLPHVKADARWLSEVFENLISNALKYGCDNPNPLIVVGGGVSKNEARFFIRDNGQGIDKAHHEQIFEPFKRLQSDKEGSGMGLAIVARILKMHSGRVWIESEPGGGATFWIALPAEGSETRAERAELMPALG